MVLSQTELIEYMRRLKNIKRANGFIDTDKIEEDFLNFSSISELGELKVRLPKTYKLEGEDYSKFEKALKYSGLNFVPPSEIGISGAFNGIPNDRVFFLSLNQLDTDYFNHNRTYLNPLLVKIFGDASKVIRDFSVHESLLGKVKCFAGDLDLSEIGMFPEKFQKGQYTLQTTIDTPNKSIKRFIDFNKYFEQFRNDPQSLMKDEEKLTRLTSEALELRNTLGSLSRYNNPTSNIFSAKTDSCLLQDGSSNHFYLYSPTQEKNILVYFGKSPISKAPLDLIVLNGEDQQITLANLLSFDLYKVSQAVLSQRVKDISALYDSASRFHKRNISSEHFDFGKLLERLRMNEIILNDMVNAESQKNFALAQPAEILEFMICPVNSDPVIHDLLAHLSWNRNVRNYHDTLGFTENFEKADKKRKQDLLVRLMSGIAFSNQQNNDVNYWLYSNYKNLCESNGIKFRLVN